MNPEEESAPKNSCQEVCLTETGGVDRRGEFVRVGVPCPKGLFAETARLRMLTPENKALPVQTSVLKNWPDGSVKWLLLDFAATVPALRTVIYRLAERAGAAPLVANPVAITKGADHFRVSTGAADFVVDAKDFRPFMSVVVGGRQLLSPNGTACLLELEGGEINAKVAKVLVETEGPLRSTLLITGSFEAAEPTATRFACRLHFFAGSSQVAVEFTLLNPRAARHPGGLWDLGDSGSLLFRELALHIPLAGAGNRVVCFPEPTLPSLQCGPGSEGMRIYQESSGGENWLSPVHRTKDGKVHLRFSGYLISRGGETLAAGKRATPVVWCGEGETGVAAVLPRFWQEFPKAFTIDATGLRVELFPGCSPDLHELQGGEQKTTLVYLDFAVAPEGLAWAATPLLAVPTPSCCRDSGVLSNLPPLKDEDTDLVDQFISPAELLHKREVLDEFGWRNFGDLYADHEALYHEGPVTFVSHYNNQYDAVGGAYRKFLATGDPGWGALASDLARHVSDIDLYHTDQDREEYCQGLHWHTDHYVDAGLSTHRSCSREHLKVKDPRYCGGGPGSEHCYSSGLALHYFLTGDPAYLTAVVKLADWCQIALTGPRTIQAALMKSVSYVKQLRRVGKNRPVFPRYPFTRGTGNAITTSLDAFEVSGERKYLAWVEEIIRETIHPDDDIDGRNLLDAETGWSYTVLLVAIAGYIDNKIALSEYDENLAYARSSLISYAKWMSQVEYPYLDKPGILEYPNETWAAQDLRKSVIFHYAARYGETPWKEQYLERARFFFETARDQLSRRPTSKFTRPVVLMLQNGWVGSRIRGLEPSCPSLEDAAKVSGRPSPALTLRAVASRVLQELGQALRESSLKRELAWFKARISQ